MQGRRHSHKAPEQNEQRCTEKSTSITTNQRISENPFHFYRNECLHRAVSVAGQVQREGFYFRKAYNRLPVSEVILKEKNKSRREILNCVRMDTSRLFNTSTSRWLTTAQTPQTATGKASISLYKYVKQSMNAEGMT